VYKGKDFRDEIIYLSFVIVSIFLSIYFDLFDLFHDYTREYENIEIDEWFIALLPISVFTILYAIRKIHKNTLLTQELIDISKKDPLTQLPNRVAFKEIYDKKRDSKEFLFLINVINFKDINHSFGITIGDQVIKKIAIKLHNIVYQETQEELFRLYGDEFAFFSANEKESASIAQKIKKHFEKNTVLIDDTIDIQIDIAISYSNTQPKFQTALIALQTLKKCFNKSIMPYTPSLDYQKESKKNLEILKLLKEAKEKKLFQTYFQAIVDNKTKKTVKYETLIRIEKEQKVIYPAEFLELSKKYKYYDLITKTVIHNSFQTFKNREEGFSINLSSMDISNPDLLSYLFDTVERDKKTASKMTIELVESENIAFTPELQTFRERLKEYNILLAIDDFGSGYANIITILQLQPDFIKIDGSLIEALLTDERNYSFVEAIVSFAQKHQIKTIAEYVSSAEILHVVESLNIDFSQGYYFSKPQRSLQ